MFSKELFNKNPGVKLRKENTSHFYWSSEKRLLMYLNRPLLWRENLKFSGRIAFESEICLLGSFPIEQCDNAISFRISSCTAKKKIIMTNILRVRSWVFWKIGGNSNAAGWSLQSSSYLRQQQGHSGWGSAVFRAPSSGTQAPPRANSSLEGREGLGMLGGYRKCILLGIHHFYFCLYQGFTE